jgi:hypothetical protein
MLSQNLLESMRELQYSTVQVAYAGAETRVEHICAKLLGRQAVNCIIGMSFVLRKVAANLIVALWHLRYCASRNAELFCCPGTRPDRIVASGRR